MAAAGVAVVLLAALTIGTVAYVRGGTGPRLRPLTAVASPRPSPTAVASASSGSIAPCAGPESSYGLILSAGKLEMIGRTGCFGPTASVGAPMVQKCPNGAPADLAPPVSASNTRVYYRDGDTKIRFITPEGQTGDATTVPGGPTTVSFFSVSPDDLRIAVLVEDLSAATTIGLRLYVEDLAGGGHHADIYSSTVDQGQTGMTLWPTGWHQGRLILAVVPACWGALLFNPRAWHVVDAATADRLAAIDVSGCLSSLVPSAGGVVCADPFPGPFAMRIYDWTGKVTFDGGGTPLDLFLPVGLSPSGQSVFYNEETTTGSGATMTVWANNPRGGALMVTILGHAACLWIDDGAILSPDAVIAYPSGAVAVLPRDGVYQNTEQVRICVGRFPGSL